MAGIEPRLTSGQLRKAALIAATATPLIRALGATYRWRIDGLSHYDSVVAAGRRPILAVWHGRILAGTLLWKNRGVVVIISQSFDGEWIAGIVHRLGYGTARGSTTRGGARALVRLRRDMADGHPVAFTIDGPRGPARVAQAGAVFLAGATGNPLLPFHIEADRFWTAGGWDQTQVPKPFSRVAVAIGEPIDVPDTEEGTIEAKRVELEQALAVLERASLTRAARPNGEL